MAFNPATGFDHVGVIGAGPVALDAALRYIKDGREITVFGMPGHTDTVEYIGKHGFKQSGTGDRVYKPKTTKDVIDLLHNRFIVIAIRSTGLENVIKLLSEVQASGTHLRDHLFVWMVGNGIAARAQCRVQGFHFETATAPSSCRNVLPQNGGPLEVNPRGPKAAVPAAFAAPGLFPGMKISVPPVHGIYEDQRDIRGVLLSGVHTIVHGLMVLFNARTHLTQEKVIPYKSLLTRPVANIAMEMSKVYVAYGKTLGYDLRELDGRFNANYDFDYEDLVAFASSDTIPHNQSLATTKDRWLEDFCNTSLIRDLMVCDGFDPGVVGWVVDLAFISYPELEPKRKTVEWLTGIEKPTKQQLDVFFKLGMQPPRQFTFLPLAPQ